jgi:hypothetical protein
MSTRPRAAAREPLPFDQLDRAGQTLIDQLGPARAAEDALALLDRREITEIARLARALDLTGLRGRLRHIAGGSLRAGRLEKAAAAKSLELAGAHTIAALLARHAPLDQRGRAHLAALLAA